MLHYCFKFHLVMFGNYIIFFALIAMVKSAKILIVVPSPSISHQIVFRSLTQELINRDHEVIVMTTDPAYPEGKSPKNLHEIDFHNSSYTLWLKVYDAVAKGDETGPLSVTTTTYQILHEIFQEQLRHKSVQKLLEDRKIKFDLLILEECMTSTLLLSHVFKAPVIQMSTFGDSRGSINVIGGSTHPFLYPSQYRRRIYNLTSWEIISELYYHISLFRMFEHLEIENDRILQRIFERDIPALSELKNNVHMLAMNVHSVWLHNQAVPSNVIYTFGIHKKPAKSLPEDLQVYLDSSINGVIYISFGTNFKTSSMKPKTLNILLKVLSRLPYNILWKWDADELPGKSENIKISKWFPQSDVLRHPNMKLFITQGGLQSTQEAINAGVPLIGIPTFSDQQYNTEKYVHFKIGISLDFKSLTTDKLENAVNRILTDDSYRKNIMNLRRLIYDQPRPPLENTIWWIEYILRNGGVKHLRSPAANMPWTEYFELELVFISLSASIALGMTLLWTLHTSFKSIKQKVKTTKLN